MHRLTPILYCLSILVACDCFAHGDRPRAIGLVMAPEPSETVWVLSDTQGIFANPKMGFRWTCEDAVSVGAPTRGLLTMGPSSERWVIATVDGMFISDDRGCNFHRADGPVGSHELVGLWSHRNRHEYLTASRTPMTLNDVFLSRDGGDSWDPVGLEIPGTIHQVHWSQSDADRIYVHHRDGIDRSNDLGATWERLEIAVNNVNPGPANAYGLLVSPLDEDVLLLLVRNGRRSRVIRSVDGGRVWMEAALLGSGELRGVFHAGGMDVLVVDPFGAAWRSKDAGATWEIASPLPFALGCLGLRPGTTRLYACSDPDVGGPWVAGKSDDFGESWEALLMDFEGVPHRDDCPEDSKATQCCSGLCPGDPDPETCQPLDAGLPEACMPTPIVLRPPNDAGRPDAGESFDTGRGDTSNEPPSDAIASRPDTSHQLDAASDAYDGASSWGQQPSSGCACQAFNESSDGDSWLSLFVLLLLCNWRSGRVYQGSGTV